MCCLRSGHPVARRLDVDKREQVGRLERVFQLPGESPKDWPCRGMPGIIGACELAERIGHRPVARLLRQAG